MAVEDVVAAVADRSGRIADIQLFSDYYNGVHRIGQYASKAFRKDFMWVLENSRENLCKAVVRGFSSKMRITGWDGAGAKQAGQMVKDLGLTRIYNLAHREAFRTGNSYVLVWPDNDGTLRAWPKLSGQCAVKTVPGSPGELEWFAMLWVNADGYGRVNMYYADRLERWVTGAKLRQPSDKINTVVNWPTKVTAYAAYDGDGEPDTIGHTFGRVPAIWLSHDADELDAYGSSVLEDVIPIQDALNKSVADLIVGGENFAQPLRYLMNWRNKRKLNPDTGEPEEETLRADPTVNKFLTLPGAGPIGQLDPPDATKLIAVHAEYGAKVSRVTGLPAFYVTQVSGEPPTGVALRVLSTRLTSISRETQDDFGPEWTQLMGLLGVSDVEPIWQDPAPMDEAELLEAAETRKVIGYPLREILRKLGEDDENIERILSEASKSGGQVPNGGDIAARAFEAGVDPAELLQ